MAYFARHFEFVDIDRFLALLTGREELRGRKLLVTFDDGFKDNVTNALPVLEEFGVRATFFVATEFASLAPDDINGLSRYAREVFHTTGLVENMDWNDLRELARRGHTVGSHTMTHRRMSGISASEARRELEGSRSTLGEQLGRRVEDLSYPYGRASDGRTDLVELARSAGYRSCFSAVRGENRPGTDPYLIRREAMEAGWPLVQVKFFMRRR
jgi:peptidoglycan/xylan/chitin deacetylase (PgdA/CDA1 family)